MCYMGMAPLPSLPKLVVLGRSDWGNSTYQVETRYPVYNKRRKKIVVAPDQSWQSQPINVGVTSVVKSFWFTSLADNVGSPYPFIASNENLYVYTHTHNLFIGRRLNSSDCLKGKSDCSSEFYLLGTRPCIATWERWSDESLRTREGNLWREDSWKE